MIKKNMVGFGAFFISLLLISTATAVPQSYSESTMNVINKMIQQKEKLNEFGNDHLFEEVSSLGIIDTIIQLIRIIIDLVLKLIEFVSDLINLIGLVQTLINAINTLLDLIQQLIQMILEIFNPNSLSHY